MSKLTTRIAAVGAAGFAVLGLLTACAAPNSGSNDSGAPKKDPRSSSDNQTADQAFTEWQVKFAQCMREEGIDMPDPNSSGQVQIGGGIDAEAFTKADDKCTSKIGSPPVQDGKGAEQAQKDDLKLAQCLRAAGYDYKDPEPGGAREIRDDIPQSAFEKCSTEQKKG
ncbi:hypothetical protein [Leucobacter iarius]|uniref:Secreted protein n=1 Tax=Leucobacter iarius TaxID=333963 RepID=A0ABN2LPM9_9MICO